MAVSYQFFVFTFFPGEVPSGTPQPRALQLDLRRVNERNQKVGIVESYPYNISACPKSAGYVRCQVSSKERDGSSSLLLKPPYMYIPDTKKNYLCFLFDALASSTSSWLGSLV